MNPDFTRRRLLGGVATATVTALAGCSGGGGGSGGGGSGGPEAPTEVEEWLSETSNFDGTLTDETGSSSVSVNVGAEGNGGYYAFAPAAIQISTGTTVTWEWTGQGGDHNVVEKDTAFDSGSPKSSGTFEHTFEEAGTFLYYCAPHKSLEMKGAVVVE